MGSRYDETGFKVSRRPHTYSCLTLSFLRLTGVQYHCNATLPGQEENHFTIEE
jgi:hypothetical protein